MEQAQSYWIQVDFDSDTIDPQFTTSGGYWNLLRIQSMHLERLDRNLTRNWVLTELPGLYSARQAQYASTVCIVWYACARIQIGQNPCAVNSKPNRYTGNGNAFMYLILALYTKIKESQYLLTPSLDRCLFYSPSHSLFLSLSHSHSICHSLFQTLSHTCLYFPYSLEKSREE